MPKITIENPIINSPFDEPQRHFKFDERGITEDIVNGRRRSEYFIPVPKPRKQAKNTQTQLDLHVPELRESNAFINRVRGEVTAWRKSGYPGVTETTRRLLEHWHSTTREPRLFFCQREAVETAIYIHEVEKPRRSRSIHSALVAANKEANPGLFRIAFKMATGSGKTVVMAMLIVYHTLNKIAAPSSARFSDTFLIVTPGLTIRDRLQVLRPEVPGNYYDEMGLLPPDDKQALSHAKIVITNYHAFQHRKNSEVSGLGRKILGEGAAQLDETDDEMVSRVCRAFGRKRNIIVLNDEAHHCYRPKQASRKGVSDEDGARLWISGLEAVQARLGIKTVYDLSATPFFLSGSGYSQEAPDGKRLTEGVLFPWVVSDFALIDAIESGIAKIPRVPIADDAMTGEAPIYRNLWRAIGPRLRRKVGGEGPQLPAELETALKSLYDNYETTYQRWQKEPGDLTPPVMIVVCNNTSVSKRVYDWIAGWEKKGNDGDTVVVPGNLPIFSNEVNGAWGENLNTLIIDSKQLESGEALKSAFKKAAKTEIAQFKRTRGDENVTDEALLREVMNTVGQKGKLGEQIKCVVSVAMLSEGWDAKRVTHILGVRAFSTQLLCEQVVGRGLRRSSYHTEQTTLTLNGEEMPLETFPPEYAEVYGVPFSFIPATGVGRTPKPRPITVVKALAERAACEITFPKVVGYRRHAPQKRLQAVFTEESQYQLSTAEVPSRVDIADITGTIVEGALSYSTKSRVQQTQFHIAKVLLENYFRDDDGDVLHWHFPQLLGITRQWMTACVSYKDNTYPQFFLIDEIAHKAAHRINQAILRAENLHRRDEPTQQKSLPILDATGGLSSRLGSTQSVDFETTKPVWSTHPEKCHVSHVVADTESWEQKAAEALEQMDEVHAYVKNQNLGFTIPYLTHNLEKRHYVPDFIVRIQDRDGQDRDGQDRDSGVNLILEVSGVEREDKRQKVDTTKNLWVPAVNNHGGFGKWAFLEITDPWDIQNTIRAYRLAT